MSNFNKNNNHNQQDGFETVKTTGKQPRTIHVAHRKSPSELTSLMQEQLNLQRQLELVQVQQQQLLQQQHQLNQKVQSQTSGFIYQTPKGHHRKTSSNFQNDYENFSSPRSSSHRRSQSSISSVNGAQGLGHSRRHSLGLAEAKKAAAEVQAQRNGYSPSKLSLSRAGKNEDLESNTLMVPPSFRFPDDESRLGHSRSRSNVSDKSPQRNFQFPPKDNDSTSSTEFLVPPQPSFAEKRQSGSYSHKSTSSDINGNWRKSGSSSSSQNDSGFVPSHRPRGSYGGSVSSISQFNSQGRKSLFAPYLPQSSLPDLINEGKLVIGTLRVNKKNRSDAYVSTDGLLDADIFICGSKDRNRALEGDVVAVELLVVDDVWSSKREKEEKKRRKDSKFNSDINDDVHNDASTLSSFDIKKSSSSGLNRKGSLKQRPTQKKNDDVEVEGQSLLLVEEEEINDDVKPLYAGHIVAVVDRIPGQLFAGTLGLLRPSQIAKKDQNDNEERPKPKIVWFKPIDKKVPLIAIPTEQAPKDFVENHDKYANQTFIASIKRWPITSLHPFGTLVSRLGDQDDQDVEVESILRDNNFMCDEYDEDKDQYMNELLTSEQIIQKSSDQRRNLNSEYVIACTQNGDFSDHAFHIKGLEDNKIELGVHISDIGEFVIGNSGLDKRVKKRSHGVFLPQKNVNLFPDVLNNEISFDKGKLSPALSIIFEIDLSSFETENIWMGETIVQPNVLINYEQVDQILDNSNDEATNEVVHDEHKKDVKVENKNESAVSRYIETLSHISSNLKQKRLTNSKLNYFSTLPLLDQLDDEPVKLTLNIYDKIKSTSMFNEIFQNVNAAVAQKIHTALGDLALLRKFSLPTLTKFEYHEKKIKHFGVDLDTTNAKTFLNSILNIDDPIKREAVETILMKSMSKGKYILAGKSDQDTLSHYLFNFPVYTHFVAPLRRYADIIVHRQLKHVINKTINDYVDDIDSLKLVVDYCNFKKDCAKIAQNQAIHLLLCQTINDMSSNTGQVLCTGIVIQVYESSFDVYLPEFGIEKRVHGDQLPLNKAEFDKKNSRLELYWKPGVDSATYIPRDETEPLSYRNSIKNKHRGSTNETSSEETKISAELIEKLNKMNLSGPEVFNIDKDLSHYLDYCSTRIENNQYIQDVKLLERVPILLRAEIGMALPCLTVKSVNPFINQKR